MSNIAQLKKRLLYRSEYRGTKEMDLLLGNFVKKNIDKFSYIELKDLENLMKIDDEILEKWYFKKINNELVPNNKVSQMLKEFKL